MHAFVWTSSQSGWIVVSQVNLPLFTDLYIAVTFNIKGHKINEVCELE